MKVVARRNALAAPFTNASITSTVSLESGANIPPVMAMYTRDLTTATRQHPELEAPLLTVRHARHLRGLTSLLAQLESRSPSREDVVRIFSWVTPHRVRVRDPKNYLFASTMENAPPAGSKLRSIEAVLHGIIEEV